MKKRLSKAFLLINTYWTPRFPKLNVSSRHSIDNLESRATILENRKVNKTTTINGYALGDNLSNPDEAKAIVLNTDDIDEKTNPGHLWYTEQRVNDNAHVSEAYNHAIKRGTGTASNQNPHGLSTDDLTILTNSERLFVTKAQERAIRSDRLPVNTIYEIEKQINNLIPNIKTSVIHAKMNKEKIEDTMIEFINGNIDCLISTTIIENGIDIPNANTIIINNADHFGLSQLYQLRGRVGRSNRIGYCYLLYDKNRQINETAMKRLNTIKQFSELGSGFKIALKDLAIRGAGDLLGKEQAGFIDSIGIDLYLKILNDEVRRLKGEKLEEDTSNNPWWWAAKES